MWHISSIQESLCVKWVHGVYTKGANWAIFNSPPTASWALRKLCGIKDKLSRFMSLTTYSIQEVYKERLNLSQPVHWDKWVWHRLNTLREKFVS